MEQKKYYKPEGFQGRGKGSTNWKKLKWEVIMFDKETNTFKGGKYSSVKQLNEELGLNLSGDTVWRLITHSRVDESKRNKENSFLGRYGHIKINKIDEYREGLSHQSKKS
jgi:hypothetical protein